MFFWQLQTLPETFEQQGLAADYRTECELLKKRVNIG